ncbi:MAG: Alkaline protease secretion ATP-binding protein AprD [Pseudomonadota bacterium]|jgi:ATP-binding cassette subfamily C exporter for protease/lipase
MALPTQQQNELLDVLARFRRGFVFAGIFSFVINVLMLAPSLYMMQVYDRVLTSRNAETLLVLTLIILFLYVLMSALEWIRSQLLVRVGARIDARLNTRVFQAAFERNLRMAGANPAQAMHDLTNIRQFLTGQGIFAFFDAPWFPIYMAVVFLLHPVMGALALGAAVTLFLLALATEKATKAPLAEANKYASMASNFTNANLRNAEVIQAMGMLPGIQQRWMEHQRSMLHLQTIASNRAGIITAATKFVRIAVQSLLLGLGAYLAMDNSITSGGMIAGSILMGRALAPVEMAIGTWKQLLSARESYARLNELLTKFPEREKGMSLPRPSGRLAVAGLVAVPPGAQAPVLKGVSFEVAPGEIVGVIGPSASGKSTLARMLMGIWAPYAGTVRLDGSDVYNWDKTELGPHVGYLPQDVELFDGTIAENIARFGDVQAELVIDAAQRAGVHEMILHLPKGYDTPIGAAGGVLSGGQRQRIGLARAMYGRPAFIVLDEPNSNLDDVGEQALVQALRSIKSEGGTVMVITHRTSVLAAVDKLLLLQAGQLVAFGPRDEVIQALKQQGGAGSSAQPAQVATAAAG